MIRDDYLLRLIEQLGEFFRRTLGQEEGSAPEALEQELESLTGEILGLPPSWILAAPPEDLIALFELSDRMVIEKCYLTAEINRLKALQLQDEADRKPFQERAVFFFDTVLPELRGELRDQAVKHLADLQSG